MSNSSGLRLNRHDTRRPGRQHHRSGRAPRRPGANRCLRRGNRGSSRTMDRQRATGVRRRAALLRGRCSAQRRADPAVPGNPHPRRSAIHVHGPIEQGATIEMTGTVERVRERGGAFFVTFAATGTSSGEVVLESRSTFLMSDQAAAETATDRQEPSADDRGPNEAAADRHPLEVGRIVTTPKSASRADLVRYAAATRDFNPLHWDHEAARAAGTRRGCRPRPAHARVAGSTGIGIRTRSGADRNDQGSLPQCSWARRGRPR